MEIRNSKISKLLCFMLCLITTLSLTIGISNAATLKYNGGTYSGTVVKGKMNGQGTYTDKSGNTYTGKFVNNAISGEGTWKDKKGNSYVGTFRSNFTFLKGTYYYRDGYWLVASFDKNNKPSGKCITYNPSCGKSLYTEINGQIIGDLYIYDKDGYISIYKDGNTSETPQFDQTAIDYYNELIQYKDSLYKDENGIPLYNQDEFFNFDLYANMLEDAINYNDCYYSAYREKVYLYKEAGDLADDDQFNAVNKSLDNLLYLCKGMADPYYYKALIYTEHGDDNTALKYIDKAIELSKNPLNYVASGFNEELGEVTYHLSSQDLIDLKEQIDRNIKNGRPEKKQKTDDEWDGTFG